MAKARVTIKAKKKQWVKVIAPKIFSNKPLGETYVLEPKMAVGRTLLYNMREVTENMRDQNVYLTFRIKSWNNDLLSTEIIGYQITPAIIKRMIRRNTSRIDGVTKIKTSDNREATIKIIIQTLHRAQRSVRTQLLNEAMKLLVEDMTKLNYGNLLDKLISHKLQADMKKTLNKIFPIKNFEVKEMKLILDKKKGFEETEEVEEEVKPLEVKEPTPETKEEPVEKEPKAELTEEDTEAKASEVQAEPEQPVQEESKATEEETPIEKEEVTEPTPEVEASS